MNIGNILNLYSSETIQNVHKLIKLLLQLFMLNILDFFSINRKIFEGCIAVSTTLYSEYLTCTEVEGENCVLHHTV